LPHKDVELLHLSCTTDGYVLVVFEQACSDMFDCSTTFVAILKPVPEQEQLYYRAALVVDGARAACGTRELTGVITASTLCIFRVGARDASITVENGHRVKFKDVAVVNASAPLFVVWGAPRGAPNGDVYVFTHAGALLARLATAMLPTAPVGMAASRHGEVAFLCIPRWESPHRVVIALLDLYSGYARVLEAPEALPSDGCSAAGIAFAPTGVVCCAGDMLTLFQ
jgi:hypothetical protein